MTVGQNLRLIEDDGRESAARIAWVSPLTSRFLIVNRRGMRKLVVSPEELAALVAKGRVSLRSSEAPFDEALRDIEVVIELMRALGAEIQVEGRTLRLRRAGLSVSRIPAELAHQIRSSILLLSVAAALATLLRTAGRARGASSVGAGTAWVCAFWLLRAAGAL